MFIKILLTVIFLAVTVFVGVYSRKQAKSVDGFVLGGRSVGPWLSAFAFGTSYFSAVVFVGYAGQFGWKYGLSSSWIGIGNAVIGSLLAWIILGRRTKLMTQHIESRTMPDFFGTRYNNQGLRIAASIIASATFTEPPVSPFSVPAPLRNSDWTYPIRQSQTITPKATSDAFPGRNATSAARISDTPSAMSII